MLSLNIALIRYKKKRLILLKSQSLDADGIGNHFRV